MIWTILIIKKSDNGWYINYIEQKILKQISINNLQNFVDVIVFDPKIKFASKYVSVIDNYIEISDSFVSDIYNIIFKSNADCIGLKGLNYIDGNSCMFSNISDGSSLILPITTLNPIKLDIIVSKLQNIHYYINSENLSNVVQSIDSINTPVIFMQDTTNKLPFSIIITAYQTQNYIEECLDSIENQSYFKENDNYEILVGVDACQDTFDKLNEIKHKYRNLKIYMMNDNKGTYITTNTLIGLTKHENIIRFDSDDIMTPNLVKELVKDKGSSDIVLLGYLDFEDNIIGKKLAVAGIIYFKKSVMDIAGGYQPWRCAADTELISRLANKVKISQLKKAVFYRRIHENSLTRRDDTKHDSEIRNYYTSLIKRNYSDNEIKIERVVNEFNEIEIERVGNEFNEIEKKVLIIIPAYNAELTILESINSIKNQTYNNIEIAVVDDCSTDNTYKLLENIENISLYKLLENGGTYKAINHILYLSKDFDYFIIHGADDIMDNDKIKKQVNAIIGNNLASVSKYKRVDYKTKKNISDSKYGDSMVLYSKKCFEILGFYDNTRFGGDSEYFTRFKKCFGSRYANVDSTTYAYILSENLTTKINTIFRGKYIDQFSKEHEIMKSNNNFFRFNTEKNIISVNMATYPPRKLSLIKSLHNLLKIQIIDKIRIYLNEYNVIPDDLPKNKKIEYFIGKNLKDSGKFYWANENKNEYYFSIDDDLIYPLEYFTSHIKKLNEYDNNIFVTTHGRTMIKNPEKFTDNINAYHCLKNVFDDVWVNNGGTGVMMFDNSKFKIPINLFKYSGMSDLWVSLYCQQNKIPILCRKHSRDELKYLNQNETLFDIRDKMNKEHKEILSMINWSILKINK